MMGDDDGLAPLLRDATNMTPPPLYTFLPRGGPIEKMSADITRIYTRRVTPSKFWVARADVHQSGSCAPAQGQPQQPVTVRHGTNSPIGENPWQNCGLPGRMDTNQGWVPLRRGQPHQPVTTWHPPTERITPEGISVQPVYYDLSAAVTAATTLLLTFSESEGNSTC